MSSFPHDLIPTCFVRELPFTESLARRLITHTCHASCVWKVDEGNVELLIFFSDSRTNFVTELFGSNVAFCRLNFGSPRSSSSSVSNPIAAQL